MEGVLQARQGGGHLLRRHLQGAERVPLVRRRLAAPRLHVLAELRHEGLGPLQEAGRVDQPAGRDREGGQDTGEGGVDPGLEEGHPEAEAQESEGPGAADPGEVQEHQGAEKRGGHPEAAEGELGGVEEGDHQDRPQVVHDGHGGDEDLEGQGHAPPQESQDPQGEGDVRGHGDAPAVGPRAAGVPQGVDRCRHQHPTHRRRQGEGRLPGLGELPHQDLALDLQAHDEEEDRHQPVVDPEEERLGDREVGHRHVDRRLPEPRVPAAVR